MDTETDTQMEAKMDNEMMSQLAQASEKITETLGNPDQYSEDILDELQAEGRDTTDLELVWSQEAPMGAERLMDLSSLAVAIEGPGTETGPTPDQRKVAGNLLAKGDRLSPLSRPTQWVVTSTRGKNLVCWGIQHEPGEEADPDAPIFGDREGWAVWQLTNLFELRREGRCLNHCVGNSGMPYHRNVKSGKSQIFSVRHNNEPRCTIHVQNGNIVETQGKSGISLQAIPEAKAVWDEYVSKK